SAQVAPQEITHHALSSDRYRVEVLWRDVGIAEKLSLIQRCAALVTAEDPSIVKVEVSWADGESRVFIADMLGRMVFDERSMTHMLITVTAERNGERQMSSANIAAR